MLTKYIFIGIVVAVILQRLLEVRLSDRNRAEILQRGGQEHGDNLLGIEHYCKQVDTIN